MAAADAVGFKEEFHCVGKGLAVQGHRHTFFKAHAHFFGLHGHVFIPKRHAHDGFDDFDAAVEKLQIFGFVGGAEHIGIGGIGFLHRHFILEAVRNQEFAHFVAAAEFVDKLLVEPGFVDFQCGIGEQAVAVEAFDVVAFVGAAVAPNVHVVFFHSGNEHGAGYGAAERGGVEVGHAAGGNMERAALDGGNAFMRQLRAAINQTGVLCAVFHRFFGNGVVVVFVGLAEVGSVGIRQRAFEFHPQEGGGGVEPAGKGDADFLANRQGLQNGGVVLAHDAPLFGKMVEGWDCVPKRMNLSSRNRLPESVGSTK